MLLLINNNNNEHVNYHYNHRHRPPPSLTCFKSKWEFSCFVPVDADHCCPLPHSNNEGCFLSIPAATTLPHSNSEGRVLVSHSSRYRPPLLPPLLQMRVERFLLFFRGVTLHVALMIRSGIDRHRHHPLPHSKSEWRALIFCSH
jgi:hypothetical protein